MRSFDATATVALCRPIRMRAKAEGWTPSSAVDSPARRLTRGRYGHGAQRVFLEVRPSNPHAIALYHDEGFNEIGRRPRYYLAMQGREDAIVMAIELLWE